MKVKKLQQCLLLTISFLFFTSTAPCQSTANKPRLIIPFGHQLGIQQTFFSHDNKLLITADEMITIISDVRSGRALYYFAGANVAISPDSRYIATILDNLVMVWSTSNGLLVNKWNARGKATRTEFHPSKEMLLIETMPGEKKEVDNSQTEINLWNFREDKVLHVFNNNAVTKDKVKGQDCEECQGQGCPVYGAWFTKTGDSIRLVYSQLIKTFAVGNYTAAQKVCFTLPGKQAPLGTPQVLDQHRIAMADQDGMVCFDEYGNYLCRWTNKPAKGFNLNFGPQENSTALSLSPAYNYAASYTLNSITVYDLATDKYRQYELKGGEIRNMRFNRAGTYALLEYLDEAPRILSLPSLSTPQQPLSPQDYQGFPEYVYATRTGPDAAEAAAIFDSMEVKTPKNNSWKHKLLRKAGIPSASDIMHQYSIQGRAGLRSVYTNSGDIINLSKRRTISKVYSHIKLSGDISFSPDGRVMLLNTGKVVSLYSIPYARLVVNLKAHSTINQFSPDGRWLVQYLPGGLTTIVNLSTAKVDSLLAPLAFSSFPRFSISFSGNNKQVTISASTGDYSIIDLLSKKILKTVKGEACFSSDQAPLYGLVNQQTQTVRIFNKQDSTLLYTYTAPKANKPQSGAYRISFSSQAPTVAIWNETSLVYIRDIHHPADTLMLQTAEPEKGADRSEQLSQVVISPNGQYLLFKAAQFASLINMRDRERSFDLSLVRESQEDIPDMGKMVGKMFLSMQSGNMSAWMGGDADKIQFSQTGDSLMVCQGDSAIVYACATGNRLYGFKAPGEIKAFNFSRQFLVAYYYGALQFQRITDRQEWFSMIPFKNGETVFVLRNGIFFGSKSTTRYLGYSYDAKSLSYKQFDFNSNRPDTVLRVLGNRDARYLTLYDSTLAIRRKREGKQGVKRLVFEEAPEISIANEKELIGEMKEKELALQLKIKSPKSATDRLALFINGNPEGGPNGIRLSRRPEIDTTVRLTLTPGNNFIEISAFNVQGSESYRYPFYVQYVPDSVPPPMVYFAGIGAAAYQDMNFKDLDYARKDIADVLDSLKGRHGNRLVVQTLFDNQVTRDNLLKLRDKFTQSRPEDIVIVYYSGHGRIDPKKTEAFFGTYDMDYNKPGDQGIAIKDFNDLMENIPSRNKVVFLDACHSGELNKEGMGKKQVSTGNAQGPAADPESSDSLANGWLQPGETEPFDIVLELFTDLYQGNGTNIIVSARGLEAAKECDALKHGVFTYAVLKGIAQLTADADSNDVLTIGELQQYVTSNVQHLSRQCQANRVQRAAIRKENEYNDWVLLREPGVKFARHSEVKEVIVKPSIGQLSKDGKEIAETVGSITNPIGDLKEGKDPLEAVDKTLDKLGGLFEKKSELQKYQKKSKKKPTLLKKETNFTIQYERLDDKNLVFIITCSELLPVIRADVNGDGEVNDCSDRIYQRAANGKGIYAGFLSGKSSSPDGSVPASDCNQKKPGADILVSGDDYYFLIPLAEIAAPGKNPMVNFIFYNSNKDAIHFPSASGTKVFEKTEEVKL